MRAKGSNKELFAGRIYRQLDGAQVTANAARMELHLQRGAKVLSIGPESTLDRCRVFFDGQTQKPDESQVLSVKCPLFGDWEAGAKLLVRPVYGLNGVAAAQNITLEVVAQSDPNMASRARRPFSLSAYPGALKGQAPVLTTDPGSADGTLYKAQVTSPAFADVAVEVLCMDVPVYGRDEHYLKLHNYNANTVHWRAVMVLQWSGQEREIQLFPEVAATYADIAAGELQDWVFGRVGAHRIRLYAKGTVADTFVPLEFEAWDL